MGVVTITIHLKHPWEYFLLDSWAFSENCSKLDTEESNMDPALMEIKRAILASR
jgi:hypothetical protein